MINQIFTTIFHNTNAKKPETATYETSGRKQTDDVFLKRIILPSKQQFSLSCCCRFCSQPYQTASSPGTTLAHVFSQVGAVTLKATSDPVLLIAAEEEADSGRERG